MAVFSFNRTIVAGFAVALAIICFFAAYTYWNMRRGEEENRKIDHLFQSLRAFEKTFEDIERLESAQRYYFFSGDKKLVETYQVSLEKLSQDTTLLRSLEYNSPSRSADINLLIKYIHEKMVHSSNAIAINNSQGIAAAEESLRASGDIELSKTIEELIVKVEDEDRIILNAYNNFHAVTARRTTFLFTMLAGLFVLILLLFFWLLRRDVKKRLRTELSERVQENTVLFKDILDRISDGFLAFDRDWRFVYLNRTSLESTGRTELLGKVIWEEFPDSVGNEFYVAYHKAMETQEYVYLEAYYPGFAAWFENHIYPSEFGVTIHSRNITEKKRIESKLRHAVERFDMVASATNDILWEADLVKKNIWWNDNFYQKFGYDKNEDFTAPDMWERLLHPDDKKRVIDNINFVLYHTKDISWIDEYRFRRANGSYAEIYDRCYIMRTETGKPYKVIGSMTDISMLLQIREKLRLSEDRYRIMVEEASDAIFICDADGKLVEVNNRAIELFGYQENEWKGMNMSALLPPEECEPSFLSELLKGKRNSVECEMLRFDRSKIVVDITARTLSDGRIMAIIRDITERKNAQEQLAASEKSLRQVLSSSVESFLVVDNNGRISLINKAAERNLEKAWGKQVTIGTNIFETAPPEENEPIRASMAKALAGDKVEYERQLFRKGLPSWLSVNYMPVYGESGEITGTFIATRDITERKVAEQLVKNNEEQLKLIYNASGDVIFLIAVEPDQCFRFRSVNETFLKVTGLTEDQVIGRCIENVIPAESLDLVVDKYNEAIRTSQSVRWEETSLYSTGTRTGIVSVAPIFNEEGKCTLLVGSVHDITERKKIEEEIRRSKEDFTSLVDSVDGIVWEADAQTFQFTFVSQQAVRLLGYPLKMWTEESTFWTDHIHPQDREWAVNFCITKSKEGKSYQFEYRMIAADGSIVWLRDIVSVIRQRDQIVSLQGIMIDITEKKKSDEIIKDSEEKRRLIMNAALDAIVSVDSGGNIIFWNPQAEKIFGWKESEIKGKQLSDTIMPERYRERHKKGMANYMRTGEATVFNRLLELSAINKEGKEFFIEMSILPIVQAGTTTFTAFIRDITESKKAAEELRLSVERFETIASATHDAIWEWNLETGELWANEVHQNLYGLTKKDHVPRVEEWKSRIHPDDLFKTSSAQDMALRSDINYWESEYRFRKKDGSYVILFDRCYIVRDRLHRPIRLTGSMIDITNRKLAEEALRESEAKYRSLIEQASDFIMITDMKGNFIDVNSAFLRAFGYSKEEFVQLNVKDVIDPEQLKVSPIRFDLMAKGETILNERRMIDRKGNVIDVEVNVKMLPDGRILAIARDIRERKKAEAEILKVRGMADKLIDALPGVFYFFDDQGKFIRWNRQFEIVTGYTAEEIQTMKTTDFFPQEEHEYIKERIQAVFEKGVNDAEANFLTKKGKKIPHYFNSVLLQYDGKPCLLGCGIDISTRKIAEEELRLSEQKYKLLFNHNPLPLWMATKPDLQIIDVNESAIRHYGYSREEFLKLNAKDLRPQEDVEHFLSEVEKMESGINNTRTWRHKKKDGTIIHVEIFSHEIVYEGRKVWLGLSNDITVKVEAEEALRTSEKKYKILFENNPMPMWMISLPSLDIIDVNDAAMKHYGYSREEFLHLNTTEIRPAEDIPRYLEMAKSERSGIRYGGNWKHRKKDGTIIDVEIISHDIQYGDSPARLILSNDITERLKAETLLKKSLEDIRRLSEHLQTIREEERAHIAREIHDELGQQLTVLKMDVSWLNKRIEADDTVKNKLKELTNMLDGTVRTVRRISSELRPSLLDDLGLIAAIDWHLKEFEKRTGILTEFREPELGLKLADNINTGLFRIFQESLTNVTRHANADKVSVSLQQTNGTLILQIQDDGQGFDKEKEANKRTLGILGMKERTEMLGGKYEISSEVGHGTTVVVSIPNHKA
jgi:PAS domain S-box-containing protein